MKRIFCIVSLLLLTSGLFSQNGLPDRIIGSLPHAASSKVYRIQVGAFRNTGFAEKAFLRFGREGFDMRLGRQSGWKVVYITGIPAPRVVDCLRQLKRLGVDEVIITEDRRLSSRAVPESQADYSIISSGKVWNVVKTRPARGVIYNTGGEFVNVRKAPGDRSEILYTVIAGNQVRWTAYTKEKENIRGSYEGWYRVVYKGVPGWMYGKFLDRR